MAQLAILAIIFSVGRGLQIFARAFTHFIDKVGGRVWKVREIKTDSMKKRPQKESGDREMFFLKHSTIEAHIPVQPWNRIVHKLLYVIIQCRLA